MTVTTSKPAKPTEATRFEYMGETLELAPEVGYTLAAEYREAALALHAAKERAFAVEEKIKATMRGYEHVTVDGTRIFSWVWKLKTTFDKRGLRQKYPEIEAEFTRRVENGSRAFSAPGVTGVN